MCNFKVFLFAASFCLSAAAQSTNDVYRLASKIQGTLNVLPHKESVDGEISACGLSFNAITLDFATKQGQPIRLTGSYYLRLLKDKRIHYLLKLGVYDEPFGEIAFPPANAFVRSVRGIAPKNLIRIQGENPEFALFGGEFGKESATVFKSIVEKNQFVVGFNRAKGRMDTVTTIDLTVVETKLEKDEVVRIRSNEQIDDFVSCTKELMAKIK